MVEIEPAVVVVGLRTSKLAAVVVEAAVVRGFAIEIAVGIETLAAVIAVVSVVTVRVVAVVLVVCCSGCCCSMFARNKAGGTALCLCSISDLHVVPSTAQASGKPTGNSFFFQKTSDFFSRHKAIGRRADVEQRERPNVQIPSSTTIEIEDLKTKVSNLQSPIGWFRSFPTLGRVRW